LLKDYYTLKLEEMKRKELKETKGILRQTPSWDGRAVRCKTEDLGQSKIKNGNFVFVESYVE